jgi:hypothetical protein
MLEVLVVNVYLIYREYYDMSHMTILHFRESVVRPSLLVALSETQKPGSRERSKGQTERKLADHKLEEKGGPMRNIGRRCTGCYANGRAEQSREASNAAAKKVKPFCDD